MASFLKRVSILPAVIEHPRCITCSTRMTLTKSELRKDGFEKRIFECRKCRSLETKMVADPLRSARIAKLANSLAPPN